MKRHGRIHDRSRKRDAADEPEGRPPRCRAGARGEGGDPPPAGQFFGGTPMTFTPAPRD
jgi:hypothetical protein